MIEARGRIPVIPLLVLCDRFLEGFALALLTGPGRNAGNDDLRDLYARASERWELHRCEGGLESAQDIWTYVRVSRPVSELVVMMYTQRTFGLLT